MRILVVDDEQKILDVIEAYLLKEGYDVITALDGVSALNIINAQTIHLVILDLMLPKVSGEEVCKNIRTHSQVPIIMLTAKADEDNKIEGLAIGADDYITKPFSTRELVSRVKALLRRTYRGDNVLAEHLSFNNGDINVDIKKMVVKKNGSALLFTVNEFKVLAVLISNPGEVFSREKLVEKAFGYDYEGTDRNIDTYIKNIRQKIEDNPREPVYIHTIYGLGYKFGGNN
ncbi:MAG: two-component response regulator [Clostridiaceae bacterium]|nr:two-component response regulator [Clostridiaceae bacterium]